MFFMMYSLLYIVFNNPLFIDVTESIVINYCASDNNIIYFHILTELGKSRLEHCLFYARYYTTYFSRTQK